MHQVALVASHESPVPCHSRLVDQIEFYAAPSSGSAPSCGKFFLSVFFSLLCFLYGALKMKTLNAAPQKQRHFFGYCCKHCCNVACSRKHWHTYAHTYTVVGGLLIQWQKNKSRMCVKLYFYDKVQAAKVVSKRQQQRQNNTRKNTKKILKSAVELLDTL